VPHAAKYEQKTGPFRGRGGDGVTGVHADGGLHAACLLKTPLALVYFLTSPRADNSPQEVPNAFENAKFDLFCSEECHLANLVKNRDWFVTVL